MAELFALPVASFLFGAFDPCSVSQIARLLVLA
jgi:hypothetical protein